MKEAHLKRTKSLSRRAWSNSGWTCISSMSILNLMESTLTVSNSQPFISGVEGQVGLLPLAEENLQFVLVLTGSAVPSEQKFGFGWANLAVRTHWLAISEQPHQIKFFPFFTRPHCHGNSCFWKRFGIGLKLVATLVSTPFMILSSIGDPVINENPEEEKMLNLKTYQKGPHWVSWRDHRHSQMEFLDPETSPSFYTAWGGELWEKGWNHLRAGGVRVVV